MKLADFDFSLPSSLIAKHPLPLRRESRLLLVDRKKEKISHHHFYDLPELLNYSDLLVLNDSRVVPARLMGHKKTGAKVEILLERSVSEKKFLAVTGANHRLKTGEVILVSDQIIQLIERDKDLTLFQIVSSLTVNQLFTQLGEVPLPPYLGRTPTLTDRERYQTVYAKVDGSCAAPTAGLHFDEEIFNALKRKGINWDSLTLHVGLGTFQPLREEQLVNQTLHAERMAVSASLCKMIEKTKQKKGRVIAVGTTSLRSLETASLNGKLEPYQGESQLFIYPGYQFNCIDGLVTNFHLPKTSLFVLVCALAGHHLITRAYQEAIRLKYRFYSYGDAMLIL